MTKEELISALEWFRNDAEIHVCVEHPALTGIAEIFTLTECRYRLQPARLELVAVPVTRAP